MVRKAAIDDLLRLWPGRRHPLWARPLARSDPLPGRWPPGTRHQPGRKRDQASMPDQKKCPVCRPRSRGRKLGTALIRRGHLQAQRRQPGRLPRRNPRRHRQRPSAEPDRGTHALAIPENVKPESIGDRRGAYKKTAARPRDPAKANTSSDQNPRGAHTLANFLTDNYSLLDK